MAPPEQFTAANVAALKAKFESAKQGHVFTFYDSLTDSEKETFFQQLQKIDPARINKLWEYAQNPPKEPENTVVEPLPESATASILDSKPEDLERWYNLGLDLIGKGRLQHPAFLQEDPIPHTSRAHPQDPRASSREGPR
ncbi:hypothetical protein O1611_g10443 [Lasiodiplodia mahajangana]|uniref:Uncharacterized protein n=1 Tax=Lasiodiplodia mahajangana TaxID=1108764 RepID=A0ACC2IY44_9PEZI|nr:hypothetical protein O1611_g10443 [Lasiodiplodia mahajangana]